jgi:hypothetical protein
VDIISDMFEFFQSIQDSQPSRGGHGNLKDSPQREDHHNKWQMNEKIRK